MIPRFLAFSPLQYHLCQAIHSCLVHQTNQWVNSLPGNAIASVSRVLTPPWPGHLAISLYIFIALTSHYYRISRIPSANHTSTCSVPAPSPYARPVHASFRKSYRYSYRT
eukprot:scaffold203747_cov24-Prasinocladus_malaysianus.AAC.1